MAEKIKIEELKKGKNLYRHGLYKTKLYKVWCRVKSRTLNPRNIGYADYGGRGITICKEWHDFENFYNWSMANGYREELYIDRINNNGNYEPSNCRWVTFRDNMCNRRNTIYAELDGVVKPISVWADELGINYFSLHYQIKRNGKTLEEVVR